MSPKATILRALITAGLVVAVAASSSIPAAAEDVETLRERAQAVADQLTALEHRKADLEHRRAGLEQKIVTTTQELGALELEIQGFEQELEEKRREYVSRAIDIYKSGSDQRLALLLSARDIDELAAIAHATGAATTAAERSLQDLERARDQARSAQDEVDVRKQELLATQERVTTLSAEIATTLIERRTILRELTGQIEELEAEARRAARIAAQAATSSGYRLRPSDELIDLLAPAGPAHGVPDGFVATGVTFEGIASWYGPGFEGNLTASGDVFDSSLYTAASKELPLGTWLYVEHEGRGVVVLINDRGPYVGDRILDLSRAAAEAIGISGLGWVKAEIVIKAKD